MDEVKVVTPSKGGGVQSTIVVSNTDLVTAMVVRLMKNLNQKLDGLKIREKELEKSLLLSPTEKALSIAKILVDTDVRLIKWKELVTEMNPNTQFDINLRESEISSYIRSAINRANDGVSNVKFLITSLQFDFDVKNDRRNLPYFYNVKVGDLRPTEFPIDIAFEMEIDKTELSQVISDISQIESQISNRRAIQDEATAKITEASIANNPELQFLANIEIEPQNLLKY
jgi:hypothetical protein